MTNPSILAAFERMWQHITAAISSKSDIDHTHPIDAELSSTSENPIQNKAVNDAIQSLAVSIGYLDIEDNATIITEDGIMQTVEDIEYGTY